MAGAKFYFYEDLPVNTKDAKVVTPNAEGTNEAEAEPTNGTGEDYSNEHYNGDYTEKPAKLASYNYKLVHEAIADEFGVYQLKAANPNNILCRCAVGIV